MDGKKGYAIALIILSSVFLFQCSPKNKELKEEWLKQKGLCLELLPVQKELQKLDRVKNEIDSFIRIITDLKISQHSKLLGLLMVFLRDFRPLLLRNDRIENLYVTKNSMQIAFISRSPDVERSWSERIEKTGFFFDHSILKKTLGRDVTVPHYQVFLKLKEGVELGLKPPDPQPEPEEPEDDSTGSGDQPERDSYMGTGPDPISMDFFPSWRRSEIKEMILSLPDRSPPSSIDELKQEIDDLNRIAMRWEACRGQMVRLEKEIRHKGWQLRELGKILPSGSIDKEYTEGRFRKIAEKRGVRIDSFKFLDPIYREIYNEYPFELECEALLEPLPGFLLDVRRLMRIYAITDLRAVSLENNSGRFRITVCVKHFLFRKNER